MKRDELFDELLSSVPMEIMGEVGLSFDIACRIYDILKEKGMTKKDLASNMGKSQRTVSMWLSGTHNFTIRTISEISAALDEEIIRTL